MLYRTHSILCTKMNLSYKLSTVIACDIIMSNIEWILCFFSLIICVYPERHRQICKSPEPQLFSCYVNSTFDALSRVPFDALYMIVRIDEQFQTLQEKPFEKFMLLHVLNIANSRLDTLSNSAFNGLSNLAILTVRGKIRIIEKNALTPCHSLRRLDLAKNEISQFSSLAAALSTLVNLETVILTHNPFKTIPDSSFVSSNNSSIINLDITNCHLTDIGDATLSNLTRLNRLSMSYNPIDYSNLENALRNVSSSLKVLKLNYLKLTYFPLNALHWISDLEELSITHHGIRAIEMGNVQLMPSLIKLNLSYGELIKIDNSIFFNWPNLQSLDVSNNNLVDIPFDVPIELANLIFVDLSHNQINLKPDPVNFSSITPNLMVLQLSYNNITYNPIQYKKLKKLETLYLDHNLVIPWHRSLISDRDFALAALYVHNNRLTTVTPAMLADFGVLRYLSLQDNPYACITCEVYQLAKWMNRTNTYLINVKNIKCIKPEEIPVVLMKEPYYCNSSLM